MDLIKVDTTLDYDKIIQERRQFYRIPDRELVRTPIDKSLAGKQIAFRRMVVRTGYLLQPSDIPREVQDQLCVDYLCEHTELPAEDVLKVIDGLSMYSPYRYIRAHATCNAFDAR